MIELKGKFTDCRIFNDDVDDKSISQIYDFLNHPAFEGCKTRFMPDIHAGMGAVIGTTVELSDKVIPNVIGVDIGCGMLSVKLKRKEIDYSVLDDFIRKNIPSGHSIHKTAQSMDVELEEKTRETCGIIGINPHRPIQSMGTLGGGNHFIEVGRDEVGDLWLTIHSGSRNFGLQIATYYQNLAKKELSRPRIDLSSVPPEEREAYRLSAGKEYEDIKKGMEFLCGDSAKDYFRAMSVAQEYALANRAAMGSKILDCLKCDTEEEVISVHNYIDFNDRIIRKGAISAHQGESVVIPWNMRDGLIIGRGRGNADWNNSAPHGAGRQMSRTRAREELSLDEFRSTMEGIYTSCVHKSTLDESPMAYKDHSEIERYLRDSVEVVHRVKPVYNFKAP